MEQNHRSLFKYLDINGAVPTIKNGTLKFTSPTALNDPFDVSIQTLFAYDHLNLENHMDAFLDLLYSNEKFPPHNGSYLGKMFEYIHNNLNNLTGEQKLALRQDMIATNVMNIEKMRVTADETLDKFQMMFDSSGFFCASKRYDNQLLWAHYADKHQGVVLEFVPNVEKDSMLILAQEVTYTNERPVLYKTNRDHWYKSLFYEMNEVLRTFTNQITMTKNLHWQYEEELRVYQPLLINVLDNKNHQFHSYHDEELARVYLGAKMSVDSKSRVAKEALNRNSKVEIFEMNLNPSGYDMAKYPYKHQ